MITLDKKMRTRYFYYDVAGNITIKVDRNNRVTSWTYDKLNRPTSEVWHDTWRSFHENKQPIKKFTTTYNHSGNIATTEDGDNKFTFAYGTFGNEIKQTQNLADLEKPIEFNFVTNINGFNTEKIVKVDNKIDHTNRYEVDTLNRISNISQTTNDNSLKSVNIQYDDLGQLAKQTRFDSGKEIITTKNKYDLAGRLTNISHTGNNKTIYADYDLKWDNANRITDFDFTYLNGPEKRSESKYRYDKTSQLIYASYNFMQHEKYDFDLNGNRKQTEIQGQKQSYKTGEYNRLLSDENYSYEYDLEGNRISKTDKDGKTTKYTWDNRNRLVTVSTPTSEIEYLYDYRNRIVKRIENKKNQQYFVHDNWQIILQFDNKELKPTHRYLWGTKQDELICNNDNWTLCDHLNTIRDIVKSDGAVDHLDYNSFGKLISVTKKDTLSFAYTGKLFDQTSDLQWNINRWYDSNMGRWMSEDPIGFTNNNINFYRYAINDPIAIIDRMGLDDHSDFKAIFNQMIVNHKDYKYYEAFGIKVFLSAKLLNLFNNKSLTIKLNNNMSELNSAQYYHFSNTLEFRSDSTSFAATHELVHAYNDLVIGGFWWEASDEAMAYTVEGLLRSFAGLKIFEETVFKGKCPYSTETSKVIFSSWGNLWGTKDATTQMSLPKSLLQVAIKPNAKSETTRLANENDYKLINSRYGIKISCKLVKDYIKNRLSECNYCDKSLECPESAGYFK
jgi:RHS repeat-associated protein